MQLKLYRRGYRIEDTYSIVSIIDEFKSLRWQREYYQPGSFELKLNYKKGLLKEFKKDDILVLREEEYGYIETIQKTDDEIVIKGRKLSNFLARRINLGTLDLKKTTADICIYRLAQQNASDSLGSNRGIPRFLVSGSLLNGLKTIDYQNSYGNLIKEMTSLAKENEIGYKLTFDVKTAWLNFKCYKGKDLSRNQNTNPKVIFTDETVEDIDYTSTLKNFYNTAYVGGERGEATRKIVTINNDKIGFDRFEMFVDARDIQSEYYESSNKVTLTEAEYLEKLKQRGNEKLKEQEKEDSYKVKIRTLGNVDYKYREDYDLGDLVTYRDADIGEFVNLRITKAVEFYENNECKLDITLGNNTIGGSLII